MVKKIIVKKIMSDKEIASREGDYFDEDHYKIILNKNADVYTDDGKLLIKFRKNVLDKELGKKTAKLLKKAARKKHENRGASAGPLDRNKLSNYIGEFVNGKRVGLHRSWHFNTLNLKSEGYYYEGDGAGNLKGDIKCWNSSGSDVECRKVGLWK